MIPCLYFSLLIVVDAFQPSISSSNISSNSSRNKNLYTSTTGLYNNSPSNNPTKTNILPDIVIPNLFNFINNEDIDEEEEDPRVWVPQTECLSFRPLCLCTSQGYYVNLLKFKGGGVLGRHRHSSPVHALTLKGEWGYREHGWHASPGTYVYEPPGETHTLVVDDDCDEMITLFHVTGSLLYVDEMTDQVIGYDDVFTKLETAKKWYAQVGLGEDFVQQFVR